MGQKMIKTIGGSAGGKVVAFVICGWLGDDGLSSNDGPGKKTHSDLVGAAGVWGRDRFHQKVACEKEE